MQFNFFISKIVPVNENGFTILHGMQKSNAQLDEVINKMGEASALAQQLKQVITTNLRFFQTDHKIYMKSEGRLCLGFIKVGKKNLFYRDYNGQIKEISPLCVLDFYVHESVQRNGLGKQLFEEMLKGEKVTPVKLAYDRPSPKLIGFLKKHYNLSKYIPQNNNFVIFQQYFDMPLLQPQQQDKQIDELDKMMEQMSLSRQKQQIIQKPYQLTQPWATDSKVNIYQTTTGLMSGKTTYKR